MTPYSISKVKNRRYRRSRTALSILKFYHLDIEHNDSISCFTDPDDTVIGVVALLPIFPDRDTIIGASPSESVTTPSHAAI